MILVTGGSGFLGQHVVDLLRKRGHAVAAPCHAQFDLTDSEAIWAMFSSIKPEKVIHLAAHVGGIGANRASPGTFFYDNIMMGVQMLHVAKEMGVRKFVQVGTVCAYPKYAAVPFKESEIWDGYPEETNAPYGVAKKALLVMAQAYRKQYGFNAIYLIPTNLYGPGDNFDLESGHVIPAIIRKCEQALQAGDKEIVLWGDGTPTREFLHVEDAARGIVMGLERYNKPAPINLGTGSEVTIAYVTAVIADIMGFKGYICWDKDKPNGQPRRKLSTVQAEKEFGFKAKIGLVEGLRQTIEWYREQQCVSVSS